MVLCESPSLPGSVEDVVVPNGRYPAVWCGYHVRAELMAYYPGILEIKDGSAVSHSTSAAIALSLSCCPEIYCPQSMERCFHLLMAWIAEVVDPEPAADQAQQNSPPRYRLPYETPFWTSGFT